MSPIVTLERDQDVAVIVLDTPGESVNMLGTQAIAEFQSVLDTLAADPSLRAAVIISAKRDTFIAGADINQFAAARTAAEFVQLSTTGQQVMQRVADSTKPIVAAIHGPCLGAGTELALACHWRIATDHPKTQIGLPEVQLGLLPAAGGCVRLPQVIGLRAALDIILAGKSERAAKAKKIGLVDELVAPSILRRTAVETARRLGSGTPWRKPRPWGGVVGWFLDGTWIGRKVVYAQAEKTVRAKTGGHYPAPLASLATVKVGLERSAAAGFADERRLFGELAMTDVSRNLVQLFFATTALKKDDGVPEGTTATARKVTQLGVVGSGFMGAGIAGTAALGTEATVRLADAELGRVGKGILAARRILDEALKRRRLTRQEHARRVAAISGGIDNRALAASDLVIEAVFEDLAVKRGVLADVQARLGPGAIFATNTSTIPIGTIAAGAAHPGEVIGMHFFSPVEKMPLLEVIPHAATSPAAIMTAVRYGKALGKTVIVVADSPGFWVNRILLPYMNEAALLVEEGTPIETIDRLVTGYGFPVGPVALMDEVGLDVAQKAGGVMHAALGDRLAPSTAIATLLADGRQGRKNGRGFYRYEGGKKAGADPTVQGLLGAPSGVTVDPDLVRDRLIYAMLNEAALAYSEGVVRSARDGDLGAIYGFGFPPFRGGPLRTIDATGAEAVVMRLDELAATVGPRFTPAPLLREMAASGRRFHPAT